MKTKSFAFIFGVLLLLVISGCTSTSNSPSSAAQSNQVTGASTSSQSVSQSGQSAAKTYNLEIRNFAFSNTDLSINKGDTVIWTNDDTVSHTVTSDSGNELNSPSIPQGGTYSHTFTTSGTFSYHCGIHPSMKANMKVS